MDKPHPSKACDWRGAGAYPSLIMPTNHTHQEVRGVGFIHRVDLNGLQEYLSVSHKYPVCPLASLPHLHTLASH